MPFESRSDLSSASYAVANGSAQELFSQQSTVREETLDLEAEGLGDIDISMMYLSATIDDGPEVLSQNSTSRLSSQKDTIFIAENPPATPSVSGYTPVLDDPTYESSPATWKEESSSHWLIMPWDGPPEYCC
ncbi:hypothetical protein H2198_006283 [Neophaeococcomyces mojaviensis]|uniref:Uncharacterized protein n=1 Tax=Neophaeococcomyces mojaviensis TaxID=3383035 RepID=A0ACC3A3B4_9EURO|nr:hypothetical protein H2198_006283 [Knufia sp. JES_112]